MQSNKFLQFLGIAKKSGNVLEGYNRCEDAIKRHKKISLFIFSNEISINSKKLFIRYCEKTSTPYIEGYSKYDLGSALGRSEINILGIIDENLSKKLLECHKEVVL